MDVPTPEDDEIARVAHAIWEAEGRPDGRDQEHWMRASRVVEQGRGEVDPAVDPQADAAAAPRPVQPGFEDTAPGMVPVMKDEPFEDIEEDAGGRFAEQLSELPEADPAKATADADAAPSVQDSGRMAVDEQSPAPAKAPKRRRQAATPGR